jgi:hypothetical protein
MTRGTSELIVFIEVYFKNGSQKPGVLAANVANKWRDRHPVQTEEARCICHDTDRLTQQMNCIGDRRIGKGCIHKRLGLAYKTTVPSPAVTKLARRAGLVRGRSDVMQ